MRILTWNINALVPTVRNFALKYGGLRGFFDHFDIQIACFQEVKLSEDKLTKDVVNVDGFESFWACSRVKTGYSGVTSYVRQTHSPVAVEVDGLGGGQEDIDQEGRIIQTDHVHFVLLQTYVPNAGDRATAQRLEFKLRFLEALRVRMDTLRAAGRKVILVGDLNIAAHPIDVSPMINFDKLYDARELSAVRSLVAAYPDVWRRLHPDSEGAYTVWDERTNARETNRGLRLDYMLVSPDLLDQVVSCEIVTEIPPKWSDHAAVLLELKDVPPVPPHLPCAASSLCNLRFNDRSQPTIKSMFTKRKRSSDDTGAVIQPKAAAVAATKRACPSMPACPALLPPVVAEIAVPVPPVLAGLVAPVPPVLPADAVAPADGERKSSAVKAEGAGADAAAAVGTCTGVCTGGTVPVGTCADLRAGGAARPSDLSGSGDVAAGHGACAGSAGTPSNAGGEDMVEQDGGDAGCTAKGDGLSKEHLTAAAVRNEEGPRGSGCVGETQPASADGGADKPSASSAGGVLHEASSSGYSGLKRRGSGGGGSGGGGLGGRGGSSVAGGRGRGRQGEQLDPKQGRISSFFGRKPT